MEDFPVDQEDLTTMDSGDLSPEEEETCHIPIPGATSALTVKHKGLPVELDGPFSVGAQVLVLLQIV